jgi:hypothetical protein
MPKEVQNIVLRNNYFNVEWFFSKNFDNDLYFLIRSDWWQCPMVCPCTPYQSIFFIVRKGLTHCSTNTLYRPVNSCSHYYSIIHLISMFSASQFWLINEWRSFLTIGSLSANLHNRPEVSYNRQGTNTNIYPRMFKKHWHLIGKAWIEKYSYHTNAIQSAYVDNMKKNNADVTNRTLHVKIKFFLK